MLCPQVSPQIQGSDRLILSMSDRVPYEIERVTRIANNKARLADIGVAAAFVKAAKPEKVAKQRAHRKDKSIARANPRRSTRIPPIAMAGIANASEGHLADLVYDDALGAITPATARPTIKAFLVDDYGIREELAGVIAMDIEKHEPTAGPEELKALIPDTADAKTVWGVQGHLHCKLLALKGREYKAKGEAKSMTKVQLEYEGEGIWASHPLGGFRARLGGDRVKAKAWATAL
eukprot:gene10820-4986_t